MTEVGGGWRNAVFHYLIVLLSSERELEDGGCVCVLNILTEGSQHMTSPGVGRPGEPPGSGRDFQLWNGADHAGQGHAGRGEHHDHDVK